MKRTKESALDKFLAHHPKHCTYWVFSGDRHCSCGRDAAIAELQKLRELVSQVQPVLFPAAEIVGETDVAK